MFNRFEAELVDSGVTVLKCMLHISAEEQKKRLLARLDDPTKHYKFNPRDVDERARPGPLAGDDELPPTHGPVLGA